MAKTNFHNLQDIEDDITEQEIEPLKQSTDTEIEQKNNKNPNYQTMDFFTDYGTQRITINGDLKSDRPIIITYHDIGINHQACFPSFFNMVQSDPLSVLSYFTIIHIDAPGHHYDEYTNSQTNTYSIDNKKRALLNSDNDDDQISSYDLLELCSQIEEIRSKLRIKSFIGFGVGASCNIWTYYAINYSHNLRGLILLNGLSSSCSWREYIFDYLISGFGIKSQFIYDSLSSSLLSRYFPTKMSEETYNYFSDEFEKIDKISVLKYFRGFIRRKEFTQYQLSKIKCKTLIICGEFSKCKDETLRFQQIMPKQHTHFVLMADGGFLLTESHPQKLVSSIDLFLQSLGYTLLSLEHKFGKIKPKEDEFLTAEL